MSNPREKLKTGLDELQRALEAGDFDAAAEQLSPLAKYVHIMDEADRDYYNSAKIGVEQRRWN